MSIGHKVLVDAVLSDLSLDEFLDGLKRVQVERASRVVVTLVACSAEITDSPMNRLDQMLEDEMVREEHGL